MRRANIDEETVAEPAATTDALSRIVAYLKAVEVEKGRYEVDTASAICLGVYDDFRAANTCCKAAPKCDRAYVRRIERKYAFQAEQRGYYVSDETALRDLAGSLRRVGDGRDALVPGDWGHWVAAYAPTLMPAWWTPWARSVYRMEAPGVYDGPRYWHTYQSAVDHGGRYPVIAHITADLTTGEECLLPPKTLRVPQIERVDPPSRSLKI